MFKLLQKGFNSVIKKFSIKELNEKSLKEPVKQLVDMMIKNEVGVEAANQIGKTLTSKLLRDEVSRFSDIRPYVTQALRESIEEILTPEGSDFDLIQAIEKKKQEGEPYIIAMLGINGTGKTTTLAKLGHLLKKHGYSVVFAAGDTYRAGAIEQLSRHGENLNIKTIKHQQGGDSAAVAVDAIDHAFSKKIDVVIIDTAGRMQNNDNLVRELEKIMKNSEPDIKLFIGDSLAGNDIIKQVAEFHKRIGVDGIILTKIDSDVKGGAAISVTHAIKRPILFLGVGQNYDDLIEFDGKKLAKQIIP
jgi:fused signal recognition particle receptor